MRPLTLEDFAPDTSPGNPARAEDRLRAYEQGYQAGWDDAVAAETEARDRISADFAKTLEDMAFGYHEARAHLLAALTPLLSAMVERVLPSLAAQGFARIVADAAQALARDTADQPLLLRVCPENAAAMAALLDDTAPLPLTLTEDDTLGPGQALISSPRETREIDIDAMLTGLHAALDDFLTLTTKETRRHG